MSAYSALVVARPLSLPLGRSKPPLNTPLAHQPLTLSMKYTCCARATAARIFLCSTLVACTACGSGGRSMAARSLSVCRSAESVLLGGRPLSLPPEEKGE